MSELERLRMLRKVATPGPWTQCAHLRDTDCTCGFYGDIWSEADDVQVVQMGPCQFSHRHEEGCGADMMPVADEARRKANAEFIIAAAAYFERAVGGRG